MLDGLKGEDVGAPLVLWAIAEEIRTLLRVAAARERGQPVQSALREARVWGPRAELLPGALRRVRPADLEEALLQAASADRVAKGLVRGDIWEELLRLGLRLCPGPAAGAGESR
jgi:DNA polymerase-3 subunit delta